MVVGTPVVVFAGMGVSVGAAEGARLRVWVFVRLMTGPVGAEGAGAEAWSAAEAPTARIVKRVFEICILVWTVVFRCEYLDIQQLYERANVADESIKDMRAICLGKE